MPSEDVVIVPYRDGPYLVRGPLLMRDQDGRAIDLTRRTVALCRCGKSRMRPFCDGTHRLIQFRAPSAAEAPWPQSAGDAGEHVATRESNGSATPPDSNGSATAPHSNGRAAATAASLPLIGLRRVRTRVLALMSDREDPAVRAALPLIDGACRLLEAPVSAAPPPEIAALHLVKGAFDALGDAAGPRRPGVAAAAAELAAVAVALEPRGNGSCPP
jgi:CDGSH-type Zn-finger protein